MNIYWTVVTVGCLALFAILFVIGETYAFKHNKKTLSRWVHDIQKSWPLFGFLVGFLLGALIFGLAVHFFWHWCRTSAPASADRSHLQPGAIIP